MVPNISPNGHSFIDAGAYHLHDKPTDLMKQPRTANRLLFTATRNLANTDAERALVEMLRTAKDAPLLKAVHGVAPGGRKNDAPVKTISLAWKPGQTPDHAQMIGAADNFLMTMGWQQHQAVYAAHSDTAHPHIHIILNRVNPATGKTLSDWQDRKRAQRWALGFEKASGPILCQGRARKYDRGQRIQPAGLPHPDAKLLEPHPPAPRAAIRQSVRARFRAEWALYYREQHAALRNQKALTHHAHRLSASLAREGAHDDAVRVIAANDDRRTTTVKIFARRRRAIIHTRRGALRASLPRPSAADQRAERKRLLAQQTAGYAALRSSRADKAAQLARADIQIAFAHRWAETAKLPREQQDAARAALLAEQSAAMAARLLHYSNRLGLQRRQGFQTLSQLYRMQRRFMLHRHRQSWAQAAQTAAFRQLPQPVRAPPPEPAGQGPLTRHPRIS